MQGMKPAREFRTLIENETSLNALLDLRKQLGDYLPKDFRNNERTQAYLWRDVLWGIWGQAAENGGKKIIKSAPVHLLKQYEQIFSRG